MIITLDLDGETIICTDEQMAHEKARSFSEFTDRVAYLQYRGGYYAETYPVRGGWAVSAIRRAA